MNHIEKGPKVQEQQKIPLTPAGLNRIERKKAAEEVEKQTVSHIDKIKKSLKGPKKFKESNEKQKHRSNAEVFKNSGNITPVELGQEYYDFLDKKNAELKEKGKELTAQEELELRKKFIEKMPEDKAAEILEKRVSELKPEVLEALVKKDKKLGETLKKVENPEFKKILLATYGPEKLKSFGSILKELQKDGKKIPDNLDEFEKLLKEELKNKIELNENNEGIARDIIDNNNINSLLMSSTPQQISNIINNGNDSGLSTNVEITSFGLLYKPGEKLDKKTMDKLENIYGKNDLIIKTIEKLSDHNNFKANVAHFLIDAYNKFGRKIKQANGELGGVRTLEQQRNIMSKGSGATKVKDPSHSYHTKGEAIDLQIKPGNLDLKVKQLAAAYGLWNGEEMWGWDHVHFQSEYSGSRSKKQARLARMAKRGTLPKNV